MKSSSLYPFLSLNLYLKLINVMCEKRYYKREFSKVLFLNEIVRKSKY